MKRDGSLGLSALGSWSRFPGGDEFPFEWQRPARTEEWACESARRVAGTWRFAHWLGFPWATLIDLQRKGHAARARALESALEMAPPKMKLLRATACQHIWALDLLPWFKKLKITDVFWSHAAFGQEVVDGIRFHSFPLYPVRCDDAPEAVVTGGEALLRRPLLYSFVGAHSEGLYLTPVRNWIYSLPPRPDAVVMRRSHWHFELPVYKAQIAGQALSAAELAEQGAQGREYIDLMLRSRFCLCPSGSGPNSIRLWEALGLGAIPVLLSDSLRLPGTTADWDSAIIRVPESAEAVARLPGQLEAIARQPARLQAMQHAGRAIWARYCANGPDVLIAEIGLRPASA